jgi:hypothetical protein
MATPCDYQQQEPGQETTQEHTDLDGGRMCRRELPRAAYAL